MSGTAQDFRLRSKTCRKSILLLVLLLVHWSLVHHFQDFWGLDLAELCLFQAVRKVGGGWQGSQDHQSPAPLVPYLRSSDGDRRLREREWIWALVFFSPSTKGDEQQGKNDETCGISREFLHVGWFRTWRECPLPFWRRRWCSEATARAFSAAKMTGTPYMLYKDHCNRKSNQQNLGSWDQFGGRRPPFPVLKYPHGPMVY